MAYAHEQEFEQNMGLINLVIKQLHYDMDNDDQFQQGGLGLMYAIEHFDPSQGYAFSTYATSVIKYFILTAYAKELEQSHHTVSFDAPITSRNTDKLDKRTLGDMISDTRCDSELDLTLNRDLLLKLLQLITPAERNILTLRYLEEKPLSLIAKMLNKNDFVIRKMEHNALQHCRKIAKENGWEL